MKKLILLLIIFCAFNQLTKAQSAYAPAPVKQVKVAVVIQDPPIPSHGGIRFHDYFTGIGPRPDPWSETWTEPHILVNKLVDSMNAFSHGVINYTVEYIYDDTLSYTSLNGTHISLDSMVTLLSEPGWPTILAGTNHFLFDYQTMISHYNLCAKRDSNLIQEIWVYGFPYSGMWESCMAGTNAFWINGPVITGTACADLLPVMGFNMARDYDMAMHSFAHRFEGTMEHVYGRWDYTAAHPNNWERFSSYNKVWPDTGNCGNCHFPPNAVNDYEYGDTTHVYTFADVWLNYPNLSGSKRLITCSEWHCTIDDELTYFSWWYRHVPHFDCVNPADHKLNNWWHYFVDYNEAVTRENNFNNNTINCNSTTNITHPLEVKAPITFDVAPNPFTSQTTITFSEEQKNLSIKIIDILGKEVKTINFSGQQIIIERKEMHEGIYFVQITEENKNMVNKKIIIQ